MKKKVAKTKETSSPQKNKEEVTDEDIFLMLKERRDENEALRKLLEKLNEGYPHKK